MKISDLSVLNVKNPKDLLGKAENTKNNVNNKGNDEYKNSILNEENGYNNLKPNIDKEMLQDVMERANKAKGLIHNLVGDMLKRQMDVSNDPNISMDDLMDKFRGRIESGGDENFTIDEIAQKEADALLGPGGEWSPEKVSDRIVDFSIAIFGGDKSKIDIIRDAINRGFGEAEKEWGSALPDVTNETRNLIDEKLDKWIDGESKDTKS